MITALIATLSTIAYLTVALFAARGLYGRMRAKSIGADIEHGKTWRADPLAHAVESFNEFDRPFALIAAIAGGLAWPACIPGVYGMAWLLRWFDRTAPKSGAELKLEHDQMQKRIRELERELGIGKEA